MSAALAKSRGPLCLLMVAMASVLAVGVSDSRFLYVVWGLGLARLGFETWSTGRKAHDEPAPM